MLTIFSITTANPIWDITCRGENTRARARQTSPLPFFCPSSLFDATRSVHFSTQESSANLEPGRGTAAQTVRDTVRPCPKPASYHAPLGPAWFHNPRTGVTRTFHLQGRYFAQSFVFEVKILKEIPIKVDIRTVLSESKMCCYQQIIYYISEL